MNEAGIWVKVSINSVNLEQGYWHSGVPIDVVIESGANRIPADDLPSGQKPEYNPRKAVTKDGTVIELGPIDNDNPFGVSLSITRRNHERQIIWSSDLENCHSLVVSPNERYVAYKCELNGLIVRKL
ncbi:MAG: hypothetical protein A3I29_03770 [Candidatus Magasanikbacteria bacterium RIFCSPLOWO2_02_FULL_44_11]|uniref:Uncharacterized protein n=1 Tax=Candidatus Magasanikbacteria bacterium RIFCSPLOWO2_02_FULL_44_11 TaxID=1798689 RepID=A0A1F6NAF9_9BACT|nr:MAG: hypothetical protein A3I29_03770 [Candidatus Magasanikbacteria bacterium RIFCSPLOWO2_02_FULL_44_11]